MKIARKAFASLARWCKSLSQRRVYVSKSDHSFRKVRSDNGDMRIIFRVDNKVVYDGPESKMPPEIKSKVAKMREDGQAMLQGMDEAFKDVFKDMF